jgi:alpha-glucosidase
VPFAHGRAGKTNREVFGVAITAGTLGKLHAVEQRGADVVLSFESSDLILTPVLPNAIRHTWVPRHWRLHTQSVTQTYAVCRNDWPEAPVATIAEDEKSVRVRSGDLLIEATRDPFHLRYSGADGRSFLEEAADGGLSWSYWEYALRYRLDQADRFYGMGQPNQLVERLDLDHRGHLREVWNQHLPPAASILPAILSLRGYGLLIDNSYKAVWDLGSRDPSAFSYRAEGGGLQYYVFHGPGLPRLLRTYAELTGYPLLPPRWVFGLMQSRYGYRSRRELETIADTFRSKGLPCDALILDLFWFKEMGDLAFNPADWPDPAGMIGGLKEQGFRVMVIEEPYLTVKSRNYPEALDKGYLATHYDGSPYTFDFWPGECALMDFSNPQVRDWWTEQHRPLLELGVAGWWTDLNEPTRHFQDMCHHGGSAAAVHNLTAFFMHQAISAAHQRYAPDRRVFILSRAAFAGSQRYGAALWSGDVDMTFAALRKQVAVGLSAGMAGFPFWGSDIGGFGFGGRCTPELYARWFQFGAFCPLCRPHGDQAELREPWQFGPEIEAICRKYLELRYRLLPYIYNAAHEACASAIPIMRPLVLGFPDDSQVLNLSDEYLFGPEILVAPILDEGASERVVYLPAGVWIDFWTETAHRGPVSLKVSAPLDKLPLFIRQGAIIPMGPEVRYSWERPLDPLTLEIYRGADRSITLYEDDGETTGYQSGACVRTDISVTEHDGSLACVIEKAQGSYPGYQPARTVVLHIHGQAAVREVMANHAAVAPMTDEQSLEQASAGWWRNPDKAILTIKLPRTNGEIVADVA